MNYKYDLNTDLIEFCIVINNCRRWSGIDEQVEVLKSWKGKVNDDVYDLMSYGLDLMIDGRDPKIVEFYLSEFIDTFCEAEEVHFKLKQDLRLVKAAILWIHSGEGIRLVDLLNTIENPALKSEYKNWMYLNQFDFYLKREDFIKMSTTEIHELTQKKPYIDAESRKGR